MKKSTKKIMILYSLILVVTLLSETILANAIAATFTISSGVYPGAPSYTVWREGSTYYAKNSYGSLISSSTNASSVINAAIAATDSFGLVKLLGTITLTYTIAINATPVNLEFEKIVLSESMVTNGINITNLNTWPDSGIYVKGNSIEVESPLATWNQSAVLLRNCVGVLIEIQKISYTASGHSGIGVEWYAGTNEWIMGCTLQNLRLCAYFRTGIYLHTSGNGYINENRFTNTWAGAESIYCLKIYNDGNGIGGNKFDFQADTPDNSSGYGIWVETSATAMNQKTEGNIFLNYIPWDVSGTAIAYHADSSATDTLFIGGNPGVVAVPPSLYGPGSYWNDSGVGTSFIGVRDWATGHIFTMTYWSYFNATIHPAPASLREGQIWYCYTHHVMEYYNGSAIITP